MNEITCNYSMCFSNLNLTLHLLLFAVHFYDNNVCRVLARFKTFYARLKCSSKKTVALFFLVRTKL